MDWVLRSPQVHSTFSNLDFVQVDGYHVNENCNSALETILQNILAEDKYLRLYRRSISFGQNINKDIIPLFIHAKEEKTIELLIRILVNLTIPIECLLNVDLISKTDYGRHTVFEINNLLAATKVAFTELRASKALVDFLKKNVDVEQKVKLTEEQRSNISNCLLLLRNILHIPLDSSPSYDGSGHSVQNQILWNMFSQSVDKVIIKSMTICDASYWGVTMVQLVALLFKDQHVVTLHKHLNNWLESSLSESSEDNESNTSPPDRAGSVDSSRLASDSTSSDLSDTGGGINSLNASWENVSEEGTTYNENNQTFQPSEEDNTDDDKSDTSQPNDSNSDGKSSDFGNSYEDQPKLETVTPSSGIASVSGAQNQEQNVISGAFDCGYGIQLESQDSASTSSNEDDLPTNKPVHQKPHNIKKRPNNKPRHSMSTQDRKRKKIIKRGKANIINVKGLSHTTPTDGDISVVLKEFTVDFLMKGYNSLVQTLHSEILTNPELLIDTSHFFWLITYFLKFATQIQLDLQQVDAVLSFEIVSYLTSEGVTLCEQFELAIKLDGNDLTPNIRRQHLVVTAIREFVQAIEGYKTFSHLNEQDLEVLKKLQIKMCETEDLRSMLLLMLRHYNPKYHSKQYLQDIIVSNHILLKFLDNIMKFPDYNCSTKMIDHIRQFATPEVMAQYGLLLEDYLVNGEFVNDCIFTLMHHVGGEVGSLITLFQPSILKTFTAIWRSDFEICDDWSDLIEYVLNTFVKRPGTLHHAHLVEEPRGSAGPGPLHALSDHAKCLYDDARNSVKSNHNDTSLERWTEEEISIVSWNYLLCNAHSDVIAIITKQLNDDGIKKTTGSVVRELFRQNLISREFYEKQLQVEYDNKHTKSIQLSKDSRDNEIGKFCEYLILDGKSYCLDWVQKVLLDICYAKLLIQNTNIKSARVESESNFEIFRLKYMPEDLPVVSPVAFHSLIQNQSVPLVPWNCQQANICKDLKFLQLLHKLGFQMPVDTGKVFIRIPHSWTPDFLYCVAKRIRPIDTSMLKFSVSELLDTGNYRTKLEKSIVPSDSPKDAPMVGAPDNFYQIHEQKASTMVNFTPRPVPSFTTDSEEEPLNWLQLVQKSQEIQITNNLERLNATIEDLETELSSAAQGAHYYNSACETASVASDLTRMYVSDEDEKPTILNKKQTTRTKAKVAVKRRRERST